MRASWPRFHACSGHSLKNISGTSLLSCLAFTRNLVSVELLDQPCAEVLRLLPGPLVRIGPIEVSFYSLDVYDLVHKVRSEFAKDPRNYGEFVQDGHPALFSIT